MPSAALKAGAPVCSLPISQPLQPFAGSQLCPRSSFLHRGFSVTSSSLQPFSCCLLHPFLSLKSSCPVPLTLFHTIFEVIPMSYALECFTHPQLGAEILLTSANDLCDLPYISNIPRGATSLQRPSMGGKKTQGG